LGKSNWRRAVGWKQLGEEQLGGQQLELADALGRAARGAAVGWQKIEKERSWREERLDEQQHSEQHVGEAVTVGEADTVQ
jgi:hypothetical protein